MATQESKRSIFRGKALEKYTQNREKSILPRVVAPPVFLFCWVVLTLLTVAGLVSWLGQVPLYVAGSGVILDSNTLVNQGADEAIAVVFLSSSEITHLRTGLPAQVQIGQSGPLLTRAIDKVEPAVLSPAQCLLLH